MTEVNHLMKQPQSGPVTSSLPAMTSVPMSNGSSDKTNGGTPVRRRSRGPRSDDVDEEDVVMTLKRDLSYGATALLGDPNRSSSSSSEDRLLNDSNHDSVRSGDPLSTSHGTHTSVGTAASASKELEKIRTAEHDENMAIKNRRNMVVLALGSTAILAVVAIAAVGVGMGREREGNGDEKSLAWKLAHDIDALVNAKDTQQHNLQQSVDSFTTVMVRQAQAENLKSNSTWPFVTNPHFEAQGIAMRDRVPQIDSIAFSPIVTLDHVEAWNDYSWNHQTWIRDAWALLGDDLSTQHGNIAPAIYHAVEGTTITDPMAPLWQTSPPPVQSFKINFNILSDPKFWELYRESNRMDGAVVSPVVDGLLYRYGTEEEEEGRHPPHSVLMVPVRTESPANYTVGLLQVLINWEEYISQILPPEQQSAGTAAVVRNNCGQNLTFLLEGNNKSTWLEAKNQTSMVFFESGDNSIVLENILGIPGSGSASCIYSLEVGGLESATEQQDNDIYGALVAAMVPLVLLLALLGAVVFLIMQLRKTVDERHKRLVLESAKASAIVASMFPSTIRDRLMADPNTVGDLALVVRDKKKSKRRSAKLRTKKQKSKGSTGNDQRGNDEFHNEDVQPNTIANSASFDEERQVGVSDGQQNVECYPEGFMFKGGSQMLKDYLDSGLAPDEAKYSAPIADLFPDCTVSFADIAGFTAWSSVREPTQVFFLLETLYKAFDEIAKKRNVFKVETVGDCYVAVTGLPEPQEDHALIMVRFARDCMYKSYELTKKLEVTLGPDTAELSMRFGLHSGPVTAGVLRGDRSRFQLFGDTVNTASRMESTGQKGRIQMTQETADILVQMGKSHLVRQREDKVIVKGKGEMTTYWMALSSDPDELVEEDVPPPLILSRNVSNGVDSIIEGFNEDDSMDGSGSQYEEDLESSKGSLISDRKSKTGASGGVANKPKQSVGPRGAPAQRRPPAVSMSGIGSFKNAREKKKNKESRLVDWNVEVLSKLLKHVIARRSALGLVQPEEEVKLYRADGQTVLEEVREIITLPKFDASAAKKQEDPEKMILDPAVKAQLHEYVLSLSSMYRQNPFHNYEHASHVTMSVVKLLSRIVAPKSIDRSKMTSAEKMSSELHDHTYGITSDPLTQFAVVLSALIHDVDHTGVPNAQLVKENAKVAAYYKGKSVAEQNSLDLAWDLLMEPQFRDLRGAIYCDESELTRFRSLLVNSVMATDIVDKELKQLRNNRWDKAFSGEIPQTAEEVADAVNRKATIVLEHLIQASDVAHTMQHWHVYRKWNERLFQEMHNAYRSGRADKNPAEFWYKGEIGFFDFYIIPLAKKLKDCGVFGVSSDEYLNYAIKNREEWARKGEAVTAEMVAKARDQDLVRLERQASVRGPVIAEMKAAVRSMRSPQSQSDMFRQPSFRHLRAEAQETESIAMPQSGFRRGPPLRGTPMRSCGPASVSLGTAERKLLSKYRHQQLGVSSGIKKPERRSSVDY